MQGGYRRRVLGVGSLWVRRLGGVRISAGRLQGRVGGRWSGAATARVGCRSYITGKDKHPVAQASSYHLPGGHAASGYDKSTVVVESYRDWLFFSIPSTILAVERLKGSGSASMALMTMNYFLSGKTAKSDRRLFESKR